MSLQLIASGDTSGNGSGPLFTASISSMAELALNISIGQVDPSEIEGFVNAAAYQAETDQPEGTQIELDISGWTFLGTDYSSTVASYINGYWSQGQFQVNGEDMQAWPGASQIAYGGNDTLTVQYVKGQIWILYLALAIGIIIGILLLVQYFTGQVWGVSKNVGSTESTGGIGAWWNSLGLIKQAAIVGGGLAILAFGLIFAEKYVLAEAGASKISIGSGY